MGTISPELTKFRDAVDGKLDAITSKCKDIVSKMNDLTTASNSVVSSVSASYQGEGVAAITSAVNSLVTVGSAVETSINGTVASAVSEANAICTNVNELEKINKEIEELKSKLNSLENNEENKSARSNYQSQIDTKEKEFDTLNTETEAKLSALKAKNDTIDIPKTDTSGNGDTDTTLPIDLSGADLVESVTVTGGSLNKYLYKASNGKTVSYYIYIPTTTNPNAKLPVNIYFHGLKEVADKYPNRGPYGLIKSGELKPKGIVIMPQADNGTKDKNFVEADYEAAVLELTYKVCKEHNGDTKRISVAGHSNGGAAVGHIVANNPGVFAAAAPISGTTSGSQGMNQTYLWSFRGSYDATSIDRTAKNIKRNGGKKAQYTVFPKKGHDIQTFTFQQTLTDQLTGQTTTLMDWLMSKSTA